MKNIVITSMFLALVSSSCGSNNNSKPSSEAASEVAAPSSQTLDLSLFPAFEGGFSVSIGNHGSTSMKMLEPTKFYTSSGYYDYVRITLDLLTGQITYVYDDTSNSRDTSVDHQPQTAEWFSSLETMLSHVRSIEGAQADATAVKAVRTYLQTLLLPSFPRFEGVISAPFGNHGTTSMKMIDQNKFQTMNGYGPESEEVTLDLLTGKIEFADIDLSLNMPDTYSVALPQTEEWFKYLEKMNWHLERIESDLKLSGASAEEQASSQAKIALVRKFLAPFAS